MNDGKLRRARPRQQKRKRDNGGTEQCQTDSTPEKIRFPVQLNAGGRREMDFGAVFGETTKNSSNVSREFN